MVTVVGVTVVIVGAVAAAKSRALARGGSPQKVPRNTTLLPLRSKTLWAFPEPLQNWDFFFLLLCLLHCVNLRANLVDFRS